MQRASGGRAMTASPTPEIILPRASTVQVLRTRLFQRPLTPTTRPTIDDLSLIPTIIREKNQWVLWKYQPTEKGKLTKEPFRPQRPRWHAKVNDPSTWDSFDRAVQAMDNGSGADGVGCVFTKENSWVVIDLDHVIDNGALPIWVQRILEQIRTYAEASPSGTGLHIIGSGTLPGPGSKRGDRLELYGDLRYLTMTGNRLLSHPNTVEPVNVDWLHRLVIAGVFNFTKTPKLEKLLNGDSSDYPSQSESDLGLCSLLAGLGLGACDIDRVFRLSGLFDEKWERQDYRESTIQKALTPGTRLPAPSIIAGSGGRYQDQLLRNEKGKTLPCLANVLLVLREDPKYRDLVAYDEFSGDIVLRRSPAWLAGLAVGSPWNDICDSLLAAELQKDGFNLQTRIAAEGLNASAHEHSFHPVRDYLRSRVWDEIARLDSWLSVYLGTEATPYTAAVGRCWLISGVARIMRPGVKADSVLGLIGQQGILKSTALEVLASAPWFTDHISPLGERDSRLDIQGIWVCELAELDRVRGADLARVKNFLSTKIDKFRVPYGHRKQPFPRSCIFASTSNIDDMLCDPTGNRRWWPVPIGRINIEALRRDRDQLWAEALHRYEAGEHWWLDSAELVEAAAEETERHYESGPYDELILAWLENTLNHVLTTFMSIVSTKAEKLTGNPVLRFDSCPALTATHCRIAEPAKVTILDILVHCLGRGSGDIDPKVHRAVRTCLTHAGWKTLRPEKVAPGSNRTARFYRKETL